MEQTNWGPSFKYPPLASAHGCGRAPTRPSGPTAALTQVRLGKVHLTPSHGRRVTGHSAPVSYLSFLLNVNSEHLRYTRFNIKGSLQKHYSDPGNVISNREE